MDKYFPDAFFRDSAPLTTQEDIVQEEIRIFQKRIIIMLADARGKTRDITRKYEKRALQKIAVRWFMANSEEFQETCLTAGFEPDWIRDNAIKILIKERIIDAPVKP